MDWQSRDDAALVAAVQQGEADAFAPLLDRHLPAIHAFIALKLPVPHLVDELAHDTFVFAYRNIARFSAGTSLRAWLRAIAANKVRAETERYRREQSNQLHFTEHRLLELAGAQSDDDASREVEAMQRCIEEVPPHLRRVLDLKYHDEYSAEEMAERLQRSVPWVRTTLFRIRQQLRDCITARLTGGAP
jgi:RNA polymerase sigma-70 factor (ECF subfamily)